MSDEPIDAELLPPEGGSNVIPATPTEVVVRHAQEHSNFDPLLASFHVKVTLQNGIVIEAEGLPVKATMTRGFDGRPHISIELMGKEATLTQPTRDPMWKGVDRYHRF